MLLHAIAPKGGLHALHWASREGFLPLVRCLVSRFPVDLPNDKGGTALQAAASAHNNLLVLQFLLLHGADVNHADHRGANVIYYACNMTQRSEESVQATVQVLINHGADVNAPSRSPRCSPLQLALTSRFLRVARLLLDAGADPNATASRGEPLVVIFARQGFQEEIEFLLNNGADINATNSHGSNPLLIASQHGSLGMVKLLVERGAVLDCSDADGDTPLILALVSSQLDIAEYLVGFTGVDMVRQNAMGLGPVSLAVLLESDVVLRKLLDRGAEVDQICRRGLTPLHIAVLMDRAGTVKMLLESSANSEIPDLTGDTPLLSAIKLRNLSMTSILVEGGADRVRSGPDGISPLSVATQIRFEEAFTLFM